jgi:hypothetical protein
METKKDEKSRWKENKNKSAKKVKKKESTNREKKPKIMTW